MKGFSLLGVVITIGIAGALSLAVPILVGANQALRTAQLQTSQAYYSARGGLEFAQRQIRVDGNPATLPSRNFMGAAWVFTRPTNTVQVVATSGSANNTSTMNDPSPTTQSSCLVVNVSGATLDASNNNQLRGVTVSRSAACNTSNTTVTIVSATVSWTNDSSYKLKRLRFDAGNEFNSGPGVPTGSLCTFSTSFSISDSLSHTVTLLWAAITSTPHITIVFNMSDGTTQTATAN